jgi:hypothetical protein
MSKPFSGSANWLKIEKAELIADAISVLEAVAGTLCTDEFDGASVAVLENNGVRIEYSDGLIRRIQGVADALKMQNNNL